MKVLVAVAAIGMSVLALVVGLAAVSGGGAVAAAALSTQVCVTSGPIAGVSSTAAQNARLVTSAAEQRGGVDASVIAVMVGYTESGLRILGNPAVDTGGVTVQGTGSNADSIGIFQQRASWGTVAQRLDPVLSTDLFVNRLIGIARWQSKQPWVVAQMVQGSAWDGVPRPANGDSGVYGGNYEAYYALAERVVAVIDGQRDPRGDCGTLTGGLPANTAAGSHGLPTNYTIPAAATPAEATVIGFAIEQLDKPYVFGAAGPDAYDCSGLTMAAWAQAGVSLTHQASAQALEGIPTTAAALAPGDLVLVPGDDGTLAAPGHVGLYLGDGLVLNAADEQIGIRVQTYANFIEVGHGLAALRHIG